MLMFPSGTGTMENAEAGLVPKSSRSKVFLLRYSHSQRTTFNYCTSGTGRHICTLYLYYTLVIFPREIMHKIEGRKGTLTEKIHYQTVALAGTRHSWLFQQLMDEVQ